MPHTGVSIHLPWASRLYREGLDDEHQALLALANTACDAEETDLAEQLSRFDEFLRLAQMHFAHEEAVMERLRYPQLAAHCQHHRRLVARLEKLRANLAAGNAPSEVWTDGASVVIEDIMTADLPFKSFLHENGLLTGAEDKQS